MNQPNPRWRSIHSASSHVLRGLKTFVGEQVPQRASCNAHLEWYDPDALRCIFNVTGSFHFSSSTSSSWSGDALSSSAPERTHPVNRETLGFSRQCPIGQTSGTFRVLLTWTLAAITVTFRETVAPFDASGTDGCPWNRDPFRIPPVARHPASLTSVTRTSDSEWLFQGRLLWDYIVLLLQGLQFRQLVVLGIVFLFQFQISFISVPCCRCCFSRKNL